MAGALATSGEGPGAMSTHTQLDFGALLEMVGAKPARAGKRWDCPECGRPGHVSVDFAKEAFYCWHAGCAFRGYRQNLEKRLGLSRKLTPAEQRERRQVLNESQRAAEWLTGKLRTYRLRLAAVHRRLLRTQGRAAEKLRANPQDEAAWSQLALAYHSLPKVRSALALVEDAPIRERLAYLTASPGQRKEMARRILERGGLSAAKGRFVEIEICCPGAVVP